MIAVLPMAGKGTRLGADGSKEVVPLSSRGTGGTEVLASVLLQRLIDAAISDAVLVTARGKEDIEACFGERYACSCLLYTSPSPRDA